MNPNHYLAAASAYLFANRPGWRGDAAIGKTVVSSAIIDRVAARLGRRLVEVPVGFKWFVDGLLSGTFGFAGEESAGASFLRKDGTVWTTDKDGIILGLLAAEITAKTGADPGVLYDKLTAELGQPCYARVDAPATAGRARPCGLPERAVDLPAEFSQAASPGASCRPPSESNCRNLAVPAALHCSAEATRPAGRALPVTG